MNTKRLQKHHLLLLKNLNNPKIIATRNFSINSESTKNWLKSSNPNRCIVHIKQPLQNPYLGLALEEHWFKNIKFEENPNTDKKLILFWRNQPSVVVGKFQNVWRECHTGYCRAHGIYVARRSSGGGTVKIC